jgi:hypothetical protein
MRYGGKFLTRMKQHRLLRSRDAQDPAENVGMCALETGIIEMAEVFFEGSSFNFLKYGDFI